MGRIPVKIVVAVRAEKEISKAALTWVLTHIARPGDRITLLAVFSGEPRGRKLWSFTRIVGDCAGIDRENLPDRMHQVLDSCSQMVLQFQDQNKVGIKIKMVSGSPAGVVAEESKKAGANWVILDKHLKQEEKHCLENLNCNIVVMKHSEAKIIRLNLGGKGETEPSFSSTMGLDAKELIEKRIKHSTPVTSPEELTFTRTTTEESSLSTSEPEKSPFFVSERNPLFEGHSAGNSKLMHRRVDSDQSVASFGINNEDRISTNLSSSLSCYSENEYLTRRKHTISRNYKSTSKKTSHNSRTLREKFVQFDVEEKIPKPISNRTHLDHIYNSDVRDAVFLSRILSAPPPLCSICQHKAPTFGKPPKSFDYRELDEATNGFSKKNILAEDGFGSVHRGILRDGQVVAVKKLNTGWSQGDSEFRREVGVLSCAQHRNVVMLVGYCTEVSRRVLVYEYVCNGSLDFHLYGNKRTPLDWKSRVKIAIGAARGLRYLHEDCRVGCIIHRDMRPNNILLTHDFEPLVGNFGLAKWKPGSAQFEERLIGAVGYLAPEFTEGQKITEKADVYAFGVVLLELITGRKTIGMARSKGQQFLAECSRPRLVLEEETQDLSINNYQLLDPCLHSNQLQNFSYQLRAMAQAASLCLRRDPESRPSMSKVLRILEGGDSIIPLGHDSDSVGSRSQRLHGLSSRARIGSMGSHARKLSH